MRLKRWQIWHTYSTFIGHDYLDPYNVACRMVQSGIGLFALVSDGRMVWNGKGKVAYGQCVREGGDDSGMSIFRFPENLNHETVDPLVMEFVLQYLYFLNSERKLFGKARQLPHAHVRIFLGAIELYLEEFGHTTTLYPTLLVYETGVAIIELRVFSPDDDSGTEFERVIDSGVNLYRFVFDECRVNPAISKYATASWAVSEKDGFLNRLRATSRLLQHIIAVHNLSFKQEEGPFLCQYAPLANVKGENLESLTQTIFVTLAYILDKGRYMKWLLFNRPFSYDGGYWVGRPHMYLIEFEGQCATASDNEAKHASVFKKIYARAIGLRDDKVDLPASLRLFEDYSCYISRSHSLWIWSKSGLSSSSQEDTNCGHLVYEPQTMLELLDYIYILYHKLLSAIHSSASLDSTLKLELEMNMLRVLIYSATPFGEINSLLSAGWGVYGLEEIKEIAERSIETKKASLRLVEERRKFKISTMLTVMFGFIAVPQLADNVIKPLWTWWGWEEPTKHIFTLYSVGISLAIVLLILAIIGFFIRSRN